MHVNNGVLEGIQAGHTVDKVDDQSLKKVFLFQITIYLIDF